MRRFFEKISRDYSPFAILRAEKTLHSAGSSVLTARSGSSSPDSACHREALRRGFGRRTKAQPGSAAAPAAIFLNGQPIVESSWKPHIAKPARLSADEHACRDYVLSHTESDTPDVGRQKCAVNSDQRGKGKMRSS